MEYLNQELCDRFVGIVEVLDAQGGPKMEPLSEYLKDKVGQLIQRKTDRRLLSQSQSAAETSEFAEKMHALADKKPPKIETKPKVEAKKAAKKSAAKKPPIQIEHTDTLEVKD